MIYAYIGTRDRCLTVSSPRDCLEKVAPLHLAYGPQSFDRWLKDLSETERLTLAKMEHEIDHLHRFLGTSLGLLLNIIFGKQVRMMIEAIREEPSSRLELPFTAKVQGFERLREVSELEKVLMSSTGRIGRMKQSEISRWDTLEEIFCGQGGSICWVDNDPIAPSSETMVGSISIPAVLGGYSIIEYLGLSREVGLRRKYSISYDESVTMINTYVYQQVGQLWKSFFKISGRESLPSELYLACDLACWVPYGPHGLVERPSGRPYTWRDIHPGYRFTELLSKISMIRSTPSSARLDQEYESWFSSSTELLCQQLDWPEPGLLARKWREVMCDTHKRVGCELIKDDNLYILGAKGMLDRRLSDPAKAAHGYWSASNQSHLWFSSVCHQDVGVPTLLRIDEGSMEGIGLDYNFPIALSLNSCLDLLVFKRLEAHIGRDLRSRYRTQTRKMVEDLSRYSRKHFGFSVQAGRD